jgi:DNA-binding NtrC family response regulator
MAFEVDFLTPNDKPALLGIDDTELVVAAKLALGELGYKVHTAETHEQFLERFGQVQYQVVMLEEHFGRVSSEENIALTTLQKMNMHLRRHATVLLLGRGFQTLNPMQAFQQSVHAVINPTDVENLNPVIQQTVHNNTSFLHTYRDVQSRLAEGKR